ncbi:MAG: rRNA (uracil1498-N3)-methyltransferase [Actinomycetota bacterium]|jgi:16S rRNA (uracil1498-N3)-methyltransferase|nr:rRNA (uracil1498-N3)-methyltransferase [Actinomycetota bacterium]
MSPPVFVVDRARLESEAGPVVLDGPEGRHAATVMRLGRGEPVVLTDGAGLRAEGVVAATGRDRLDVEVRTRVQVPAPTPRLVVVQALAKGDRGELAVETLTEVGVDLVVPWAAARCVTRWQGDRGARSLGKWRTAAREAAKQSRRTWFPEVADLASTFDVVTRLAAAGSAAVLHEEATEPLSGLPLATGPEGDGRDADVVLVVGPEGGVTPEELTAFAEAGAAAYRLGDTVLRTSTAGVAAVSVLQSVLGRW